ncbi:SusD/RagB family nutrient-binding outer membrane lipoprotein [Salegentibacter chungangensis]|uniref:SusD/RagB family nutrient-binding outer membrane lipoprotein n=1 Tax=Salegentibacter chungangensis TaxID=1335724 RepID=A0ABW3NWE5_9FLAO
MKKVLLTIFCFTFLFTSCEVDEGLNRDKKNPTAVPGSGLFTNATINLFNQMNSASVNENVFRLYAQYWAQTTYPDESQYNQAGRNIGGDIWDAMYRDVLKDLQGARETLTANNAADLENKLAIINFMEVYAYSVLVDTFGNVPYSEALDPTNPSPKYDDAATIYQDLLSRLDEAVATLENGGGGFEANADPVYNGNVEQWAKAANSLRLRLGMRLAEVNPSLSQTTAEKAIDSDLITDNADNFGIKYLSGAPNTNPLWVSLVQSGRTDFVAANTFVDVLKELDDPRLPIYFEPVDGEFVGGIYGSANSPASYSQLGDILSDPTLDGNIITSAEVHFLLNEAAERGYSTPMTAEEYYNAGVTQSILEWGGTEEQANEYLAQPDVAYDSANWESSLTTQKWIAMFNNGFEGWTLWRIFEAPELNAPEGMTIDDIPTRFLYPTDEQTISPQQYNDAASAIGGDEKTVKIFWDVD